MADPRHTGRRSRRGHPSEPFELLYVGIASNLRKRFAKHHRRHCCFARDAEGNYPSVSALIELIFDVAYGLLSGWLPEGRKLRAAAVVAYAVLTLGALILFVLTVVEAV